MNANGKTIEILARSETFQNYARAYNAVSGMPLALRPTETWQRPFHGNAGENAFCALMGGNSHTCAACLRLQEKLTHAAAYGPATRTCVFGLCETAVPVKLGPQTVGFLQTGQVLRRKPTAASYQRAIGVAGKLGVDIASEEMKRAYFATPVVSQRKIDSVSDLLVIFAEHLAAKSNQLTLQAVNVEPPFVTRAKQFICEHYSEELSLRHVSAVVNTSRFYFCKQFRKATGLNFTEFVTRTRIEKVQNLLLNPNLRVSEIAYAAGFQSLTHFNRTFKRFVKQSPTKYRENLLSLARRPVLAPT
jgi:AraC-like DNA-binding protein/ligand-binding sensor protein